VPIYAKEGVVVKRRFLVAQVSPAADTGIGDHVYRIRQPAEAMGKLPGVVVVNLSSISPFLKEICLCADVLVLHLIGEQDVLPIVDERKRQGLATVFEISDNFLAFPPTVKIKPWFDDPLNLAATFQLIRLSDAVQGVSEILLEKFSFLHEHRVVFENQIMEMGCLKKEYAKEELIIGWAGSLGHTEDIRQIAPVIQDVCERHSHVRFAFMGNRGQYTEVFGGLAGNRFSYTEPGNLSDYYDFLDGLDIGLAPLLATPYNICRSDVKFIEYASRGVVPVVSDVGPYRKHARHGVNAFLFENAESLRNVLEMLITDKLTREGVKERAYSYVKQERQEEAWSKERISFYVELANTRSCRPVPWPLLERASQHSECYYVKETLAESKMIQGEYLAEKGCSKEARRLWLEASRDFPGYYFPQFCVAKSLMKDHNQADAVKHLRLAIKLNPRSIAARLFLGRALKKKDREGARKEFKAAREVFMEFAPAWEELALLEREEGNLEEASKLMNKALAANPFYAAAAYELGKIHLAQEKRDLAVEAFRVAANLIPGNPDYQRQVIEALMEAGSFDEASRECLDYLKRYPRASEFFGVLAKILGSQGKQRQALLAGEMADRYSA
jgi:tetratricopeptide (TPR) repeat protein